MLSKNIPTLMITQVRVVFVAHADMSEPLTSSHIKYSYLLRHPVDVALYTATDTQEFLQLTQVCLQATTRYLGCSRSREAAKEWNICEN